MTARLAIRCRNPGRSVPVRRQALQAFTLIELLLVIALIAVLSALLFSAGHNARSRTDRVLCVGNLRQISTASIAYSADHQGQWPLNMIDDENGNKVFLEALLPYFESIPKKPASDFRKSPFICPAERKNAPNSGSLHEGVYLVRSRGLSYAQNSFLQATAANRRVGLRASVQYPSELVLYMDFQGHYLMDAGRLIQGERIQQIKERHGQMANAAFADGSVRPVDIDTIPTVLPARFWQGWEN